MLSSTTLSHLLDDTHPAFYIGRLLVEIIFQIKRRSAPVARASRRDLKNEHGSRSFFSADQPRLRRIDGRTIGTAFRRRRRA
jgi:hypothetical protein